MRPCAVFMVMAMFLLSVFMVSAADVDQKVLDSVHNHKKAPVIVLLKSPATISDPTATISSKVPSSSKRTLDEVFSTLRVKRAVPGKKTVSSEEEYDLELKHTYPTLNGFSGEINPSGLAKLQNDFRVGRIIPNEVHRIFLADSVPLINATKVWNVTVKGVPIDGSGQTVCVVDTGVDYNHPGLGGCTAASFLGGTCSKVPFGYDYVNLDDDPQDDHGHGTHVSGIVASTDGTYKGVAPNAKIVAMKVCDAFGDCWDSDVIAGIERCIDNATVYNISVISISLGGDQTNSYCDAGIGAAYAPAINLATGQNISVVVATGNTGNGYDDALAGIALPACIQNSTRVTATDKLDTMAGYAFRHSAFTDILAAPGSSIVTLHPGGTTVMDSGTSMATPHVSGVMALLQQFSRVQSGRSLTSAELKSTLQLTGKAIDDTANSGMSIYRVDASAALESLRDTTTPVLTFFAPTPLNGSVINGSSLTIEVHSSESIQNVVLQWSGINESMTGSGSNYSLTKTRTRSGTYAYQVLARDLAGNWGETELRMVTMQGSPLITFTYPVTGKDNYVSRPFSMNVSVSDEDLISFANYSITDALGMMFQLSSILFLNGALEFTFTDEVNVSNPIYADGNYTLAVYANDTLRDDKIAVGTFIIDKTLPAVHSASIIPAVVYNTNDVTFRVNASDLHLSGIFMEANFSGAWTNYTLQQETGDTYYYTMLSGNLSNQETVGYRFSAGDHGGNLNRTELFSFTVQNRVPWKVTVILPASLVAEVGSSVSFQGTASDYDGDALTYSWDYDDGSAIASGQSVSHLFNVTGTYGVRLNASDSSSSNSTTVSLLVNDTATPSIITSSYDSTVHLERDQGQNVSIKAFDYSGISSLTVVSEGVLKTAACSQDATSWTCSWSWNDLTAGGRSFVVNVTDNFITPHLSSTSYSFTVLTCSDSLQNGDETGVDCGGSCTATCSTGNSGSSSGGGGGGGSSSTASVESTADSDEEDEEESSASSRTSSNAQSSGEETSAEEGLKSQTTDQALDEASSPEESSFGNVLTGFFGKIIPDEFSFDFNAKGVAVVVMSVIILGLGSLYFFVLREK